MYKEKIVTLSRKIKVLIVNLICEQMRQSDSNFSTFICHQIQGSHLLRI